MTKRGISAHPILEPLDYELTPEVAMERLKPNQLDVYELIWSAGIATAMDGPALRQEALEICVNRTDADDQALTLLATQVRCIEEGWGALLRSEIPGSLTKDAGLDTLFPKIVTETLDESSASVLNEKGFRLRSTEQCAPVATLLGNSDTWTTEIVEISTRGLTLDRAIELMSEHGVGRPSTYADRLMAAINNDLIKRESERLMVGEYGEQVLNLLAGLPLNAVINASFSAELEEALQIVESNHLAAGSILQQFCERSLGEKTFLADWLDELVIDGERLEESMD